MAILSARQKMGAAALIMGFSVLLLPLHGAARDKVISWQFGAAGESDIYFTAFVVPDFINYLLAGGYISITLIPLLSALFEEDEEDGWRFFGAVFTWATLAILGLPCWAGCLPLRWRGLSRRASRWNSMHGWRIFCVLSCLPRYFFCREPVFPRCCISGGSSRCPP